ncbi:HSF-type DNA-binding protein [Nitzschia inconspicua]|uniref:HSF-type DNA-binding protein n=1 Tax=Nitzschia inconspicua TaxID=303405 RepID=A0A9K3L2C7_9STRA|nr:HSF-type DNA-binding protein [Nitzschia inconspicua]
MSPSLSDDIGGLSHLVEAATALTELVGRRVPSSSIPLQAGDRIKSPVSAAAVVIDDDNAKNTTLSNVKKKDIFPQKLMEILADVSLSDIVSWLPHGRSFVIIRPDLFCEQVLPKYLPPVDSRGSTKYPSFTRKLNRWGFRQATRGADTGAFHHPCFRRDQPDLCLQMFCQKSRDRQAPSSQSKRSLPPKKRSFVDLSTAPNKNGSLMVPISPPTSHPRPVSVSTDERSIGNSSIASQGSINDGSKNSSQSHPKVVVTAPHLLSFSSSATASDAPETSPSLAPNNHRATAPGVLPFVSNDSIFVATTLKQRDDQEVLRAAHAMLYEAFTQALQQQNQQQQALR